jgi:hypothetical protein
MTATKPSRPLPRCLVQALLLAVPAACTDGPAGGGTSFGSGPGTDGATSVGTDGSSAGSGAGSAGTTGGTTSATTGSTAASDGPPIFDVASPDVPSGGGGCTLPEHTPCDAASDDPWHALGVNCPGEFAVTANFNGVSPDQLHVYTGNLGTYQPPTWPPREGEKMVIFSSGIASWLPTGGVEMSIMVGPFQEMQLPAPMDANPVSATQTCADDPGLVGMGDCSNTIWDQWSQGEMGAYDLGELRLEFDVPAGVEGFSFDFAFFTDEYPDYYGTGFNDMFLVWLESSEWTGNVSFDDQGNPISLNAAFLDFKDASHPSCPNCSAPEVQGTAMEGHAATRWLTTTAPLVPGDHVTLQFVIFDLTDPILDSTVVLDNFRWACVAGPPTTDPVG